MVKYFILLDIDGTLIDDTYSVTNPTIYETIEHFKQSGAIFCLNSNRSEHDLREIYTQFGFNGPIIAENGAFAILDSGERQVFTRQQNQIQTLKRKLEHYLLNQFKDANFCFGDTVEFVKKHQNTSKYSVSFVVNSFREYTLSIHVRDMNLEKDETLLRQTVELIKNLIKELQMDLTVSYSSIFGNVLVNPSDCNKSSSFKRIKDTYKDYKTIMIGDEQGDLALLECVDTFGAVGNAQISVKQKAHIVAQHAHTDGVIEILQSLEADTQ